MLPVEILSYDPAANAARLRRHPLLAIRRALEILWTFGWFWVVWWFFEQEWIPHRLTRAERDRYCGRYLARCLVRLGPTFIKLGQALSTRPDVLPKPYVQELARLQDKVPAFDTRIALATIEKELGKPVEVLFPTFDPEPMSAASIGQVYRARTQEGDRVIVKVQRPNLPWILSFDLAVLRIFASYAQWRGKRLAGRRRRPTAASLLFGKDLPYVAIVDRFGESLFDQTDFILEGRNAERFNKSFEHFEHVRAPAVYWKYTTRRVITQERIDGVKFNDVEGIEHMGVDFRQVVKLGVRALVKQLLEDGFFHADTHPGNIIVAPNGDVVYIDWGMTDTMPRDLQIKLVDMFLHLVRAEYADFCEDLVDLDMFPPEVDRGLLIPIIADIYDTQLGRFDGKHYSMSEIIDRVSDVLYEYPFRLPERFSFLMRTVATMEGVVLSVWHDFRFLTVALPFAAKLLLTVPDPLIRNRLVGDLVRHGRLDTARLKETVMLASQEESFQVAEFLPEAIRWLLSDEGELLREALTDAVLSGDRQALADLEAVVAEGLKARDFDAADVVVPVLGWLADTPEGMAFARRLLPRLMNLPPQSALAQAGAEVLRRVDPVDSRQIAEHALRFARVALADPALCLQPAVDWLALWLQEPGARRAMGDLGVALDRQWDPELLQETLDVLELALGSGLDLRPLVQAGRSLLLSPEGAPWRALGMEAVLSGAMDGRVANLAVRALRRQDLAWELATSLPSAVLFALSPEGASTRRRFLEILHRRLLGSRPRLMLQEGSP